MSIFDTFKKSIERSSTRVVSVGKRPFQMWMSKAKKQLNPDGIVNQVVNDVQTEVKKFTSQKPTSLKDYFAIGKYISQNSRQGFWGKGAIEAISEQLRKELPDSPNS